MLLGNVEDGSTVHQMSIKTLQFAVCVFGLFFAERDCCFGTEIASVQDAGMSVESHELESKYLEDVQIKGQSLWHLLSDLSLSYEIPIGIEVASNDNELATYRLDFKRGTLKDLLTQLFSELDQYRWEIKDGAVNVFPKESYRDVIFNELLETRIGSFSVEKRTSCWDVAKSLGSAPEIRQLLEAKGTNYQDRSFSGFYIPQVGNNFTLDVSDMSLKSILNKIIRESPSAKFWFLTRNSYDQSVSIGLSARFEYPATTKPKSCVPLMVH